MSGRALAMILLVAMSASCAVEQTFVTPVEFQFALTCTRGGAPVQMSTYVVELYEVTANSEAVGFQCQHCLTTGECRLLDRQCRCGALEPASTPALEAALAGLEFSDVDDVAVYCVRVVALTTSDSSAGDAAACACDPQWTDPSFLMSEGGICGRSRPSSIGRSGNPIRFARLLCPDDDEAGELGFGDCVGRLDAAAP